MEVKRSELASAARTSTGSEWTRRAAEIARPASAPCTPHSPGVLSRRIWRRPALPTGNAGKSRHGHGATVRIRSGGFGSLIAFKDSLSAQSRGE